MRDKRTGVFGNPVFYTRDTEGRLNNNYKSFDNGEGNKEDNDDNNSSLKYVWKNEKEERRDKI